MKMNIVFLDCDTLKSNDLTLDGFKDLGNYTEYAFTNPADFLTRTKDAEILIVNKYLIRREDLVQLPNLKWIQVAATGFNNIDLVAATELGIPVYNIPSYSTQSVAQWVIACMLHHANQLHDYFTSTKAGHWAGSRDFTYALGTEMDLEGKVLGIIGHGQIGSKLAVMASGIGLEIRVHSRKPIADSSFLQVNLDELLSTSDFISLHCSLSEQNARMINKDRLRMMKPSAVLINSARGGLIDEEALFVALDKKQIAAAYLDVLTLEPPEKLNPLFSLTNCFISPHRAWASIDSRRRLYEKLISQIKKINTGERLLSVNGV
jgi:glycerate dehydrogenase